jgi:hypothetical protein
MSDEMKNVQVEFDKSPDHDGIAEGHGKIPKFFKIYVAATLIWMVGYVYLWTPMFTGWTQTAGLDKLAQ